MLRYRITRSPNGRYMVVSAATSLVPVKESFSTRGEAQNTADWLNCLGEKDWRPDVEEASVC